jgi:co-chaperonin GroES (HSP10)
MKYNSLNHVAVKVTGLSTDEFETEGGVKLYRTTQKTAVKEKSFYSHSDNIKGVVMGAPTNSGDLVINSEKSHPITYDEQYVKKTTNGNPVDIEIGDLVYFNYLSVQNPTILERLEDGLVILVKYHDLYCKVIDGKIKMLNHYILYEPYNGESIEDFDVDGQSIKGTLITYGDLSLVVPKDGRKIGHGKVVSCGKGIEGAYLHGVDRSDLILVHKKREQEIEIEGKKVFVTWNSNVFAKIIGNQIIPIGRYCTIQPRLPEIESSLIIPETVLGKQVVHDGEITAVGSGCGGDVLIGDVVRFNESISFDGYDELIVFEGQILFRYE